MYYLGIDLGGTNIAIGLVNEAYELVHKQSIPTEAEGGAQHIIDRIAMLAKKVISDNNIAMEEIAWIGIGTPGVVDSDKKEVCFAANLGFSHTPIVALLQQHFPDTQIYVGNDADVAAWAEAKAGAAKGTSSSITITLGTGVGGGMILDDKIYNGFNHAGGEFGHFVIEENGRDCGCGRKGCWETYASVSGLLQTTKEAMNNHPDSKMWEIVQGDIQKVNGLTAFDGMRAGDAAAQAVVNRYLYHVSIGIANVINILQPEVLCIGGGISKEGDTLLSPIKEHVYNEIFSRFGDSQTDIRIAKLGNDAGIIGAALLGSVK